MNSQHRVLFSAAGRRLALPVDAVEGIVTPPRLAQIPYAGTALLGAANLGGRIVPVLDAAELLGVPASGRRYDGSGEVLQVRAADSRLGLWVDRVERLADDRTGTEQEAVQIDPAALGEIGPVPPSLRPAPQAPLGDAAERIPPAPPAAVNAFILAEAGGEPVCVRQEQVLELLATLSWAAIPRAPAGFLGVALHRRAAMPVLCLAALLRRMPSTAPGGYILTAVGARRALIAVDRVLGLRHRRAAPGRRRVALTAHGAMLATGDQDAEIEPIDLEAVISEALRRIVLGFAPQEDPLHGSRDVVPDGTVEHLLFSYDGQDCVLPAACVERVVEARSPIRLPRRPAAEDGVRLPRFENAIELHGRIVPIVVLRARLAGPGSTAPPPPAQPGAPGAFVIVRTPDGTVAIAADRVRDVVKLRPAQFIPAPAEQPGPIAAVAQWADGALLRVIAPDRLGDRS